MALSLATYSTSLQDQIALSLKGNTYTNLDTATKTAIDGAWASGTLTIANGIAYQAMIRLMRYANFVEAAGADTAPDHWAGWFIWEVVSRASFQFSNDRYAEAKKTLESAMQEALSTYVASDADEAASTVGLSASKINIRKTVLHACVHQNPMLLPMPEQIDAGIRNALGEVWNYADWSFRRTTDILMIPKERGTSPTVTYGSGNTPDKVTTTRLFIEADDADAVFEGVWVNTTSYQVDDVVFVNNRLYICTEAHTSATATDKPESGSDWEDKWDRLTYSEETDEWIVAAAATEMARLQAAHPDDGQPERFRIISTTSGPVWQFDRQADSNYFCRFEALAGLPSLATVANIDTAIALLPDDMKDVLRPLTMAYVLNQYGRPGWVQVRGEAVRALADLHRRDDMGNTDTEADIDPTRQMVEERMGESVWGGGYLGGGL